MKRLFTSIMLLVSILMLSHGKQNATTRYFDVECEEQWQTNTILIEDDNTIIYSISLLNELGIYKKWASSGNVVIIDSTATSARFYSNGPLKGRIYYYFDDDPAKPCQCGLGSVSLDVYKHFDAAAKYGVEIIGPDCIADGDSVVFSINPILTGNLYSGVGMDLYNWNIFDATSAPYVQSIPYVSGDSSSVTFKVGTMTGNDSITVRVGMANEEYRIVKYLGKAAPKPVFLSSTCVPYGKAPITFEVEQVEGVKYHWASSDNNWRFATKTQSGNIVTVTPNENTSPFITITATYTNGTGCNGSSTSVEMHRTWGNTINLYKDGDAYNRCIADTTLFILDGQVAGSGVHWDLPKGWDFINDDTNGFSISIKPINPDSVLLKDTIVAVSKDTCDRIYRKSSWIYVKPASVTDITDYGCLKTDTIYKFKITGWGHAPKAEYYKWIVGNDTTISGDSLEWRTIAGTQEIKVIPRGAMYDETNYYWGDTATFALTFQPTPPDSIIPSDTCLFTDREIETTLRVKTPISGQTYHWSSIPGWTITTEELDSSIVTYSTSNAASKSYPIYVHAIGQGNCGASPQATYTIKVDTMDWDIKEWDLGFFGSAYYLIKDSVDMKQVQFADWYAEGTSGSSSASNSPYIQWNPMSQGTLLYVTASFTIGDCDYYIHWPHERMLSAPSKSYFLTKDSPIISTDKVGQIGKILPNPAHDVVTILLTSIGNHTLFVIDNSGKIMKMFTMNELQNVIDVSFLPVGNYYFVISNGETQETHKILIQH